MRFGRFMRSLLRSVLPPACPLCGATLPPDWEPPFCAVCLDGFTPLPEIRCTRCSLPFAGQIGVPRLCGRCQLRTPAYDGVTALGLYQDALGRAVQQFKFNRKIVLDRPLARCLERQLAPLGAFDLIVPVPLHLQRLSQRTYNQSLLLARELGRLRSEPVTADLLLKARATPTQQSLSARNRDTNLRNAFRIAGRAVPPRVLLVDDVMTTGATVEACSRVLKSFGAQQVQVAVLARAVL